MQVKEFLEQVKNHGEQPILFELSPGKVVQGGYHVTEIKNSSYETIDCGNSLHSWKEVIVQIWVPSEAETSDPWMPSSKFLKIWDVVDSRLSLYQDAEIRIEYGDESHLTSNYHVDALVANEDGLIVQMAPPRTTCKPREILIEPNEMSQAAVAESCCSTPARAETIVPLGVATTAAEQACCSPAPQLETVGLGEIPVSNQSGCCS